MPWWGKEVMFERRSALHLFGMRMGKRIVWSQSCVHVGLPEAGIHQALTLPGDLSGRGDQLTDALDELRANHRKVLTVPFLPICQGSRGKKRITILQGTEKKMSSAAWPTPHIPRPLARHPHHGLPGQACLSPPGILQACLPHYCSPSNKAVSMPGEGWWLYISVAHPGVHSQSELHSIPLAL